jgi:hypothetical protein
MTLEEALRRTFASLGSTLAAFATIEVTPGDKPSILIVPTAGLLTLLGHLNGARREQKRRTAGDETPASDPFL